MCALTREDWQVLHSDLLTLLETEDLGISGVCWYLGNKYYFDPMLRPKTIAIHRFVGSIISPLSFLSKKLGVWTEDRRDLCLLLLALDYEDFVEILEG